MPRPGTLASFDKRVLPSILLGFPTESIVYVLQVFRGVAFPYQMPYYFIQLIPLFEEAKSWQSLILAVSTKKS